MDDKEKMIDDIVAMLDNSVKKGDGHINVVIDENQKDSRKLQEVVQIVLLTPWPVVFQL